MKKKIAAIALMVMMAVPLFSSGFGDLKAADYNGNAVDAGIFKDHEVTMVSLFTTWCSYCIREMPDLNRLYEDLPEGVNLISICADAYDSPADLADIVKYFKPEYQIIKMRGADLQKLYSVRGYPTTLFVDKGGHIIDVIVGVPRSGAYKGYLEKLNTLLKGAAK